MTEEVTFVADEPKPQLTAASAKTLGNILLRAADKKLSANDRKPVAA